MRRPAPRLDEVTHAEVIRRLIAVEQGQTALADAVSKIGRDVAAQGVRVSVVYSTMGLGAAALATSVAALVLHR